MRHRRVTSSFSDAFHGINATPLIDVVMCLIVFFLIVGKLASDRGVAVRLPRASSGQDENASAIMVVTVARLDQVRPVPSTAPGAVGGDAWARLGISVQVDGSYTGDAKALESFVRGRLSEQPTLSVQVRADRDLSFGAIEPVLRAAGQGGAKSVRLAAEKPL